MDERRHILEGQPPIPPLYPPSPNDPLSPRLYPDNYGEKEPEPPTHRYVGPWAVYQAFDPERDSPEDLRDAALAARIEFWGPTDRECLLERGRTFLDATARFKDDHEGFDAVEVAREVFPIIPPRRALGTVVANVRADREARGIPTPALLPPNALNEVGEWAAQRAFDPAVHSGDDYDLAAACLRDTSFCLQHDPTGASMVDIGRRGLEAAADMRRHGVPITRSAFFMRLHFGLDPAERERALKTIRASADLDEAIRVAARLVFWHQPDEIRLSYKPDFMNDAAAIADARATVRAERPGTKPPGHCFRGPWAVRTVARGEGYTDAEALLSMRAIEGVPFEHKDWPSRAIALARRVLLLARTQLVVDADPRPFDVGLEAAAGRWPSLVAWVRAGKEPDAWHRRHNRPPKKTREGRAA